MSWSPGVWIVGLVSIVAFLAAFRFSGLFDRARTAIAVAKKALSVMTAEGLDDDAKERLIQRSARHLFGHFIWITVMAVLVLAAPGVVIGLGDLIGLASFGAVSTFLLSWQIIAAATLAAMLGAWLLGRR